MDPHTSPDKSQAESQSSREDWDRDEEDVEYTLQPETGMSRDEMEAQFVDPALLEMANSSIPPDATDARRPFKPQFTLQHIFWMMTFAAVGLAAARLLPSGVFTFIAGLAVLGTLWYASRDNDDEPVARMVLAGAVAAYVAMLFAFRMMAV